MRVKHAVLVLTLMVTTPLRAEWLLSSRETSVQLGQPLVLTVTAAGSQPPLPDSLPVVIETDTLRRQATLTAAGDGVAGSRRYRLLWPEDLKGLAVVGLDGMVSSRLLLLARPAPASPALAEATADPDPVPAAPVVPRVPALASHEPMYFLLGASGGTSARFQLSFRYRLFDPQGLVGGALPVLQGLHFGYTQTSLWDLHSDSKPFRDTSYRPSLFYRAVWEGLPDSRHRWQLDGGFEHESNGRNLEASRSINIAFAKLDWRHKLGEGDYQFGVAPKVWAYIDRQDNADIQRYRGFFDLGLRVGREAGWQLAATLRRGKAGVGSSQLDLTWPLGRSILSDVGAYLHLQYFDGYGQTLLDYNRPTGPLLRVGFSIIR